MFAIVTDSRKTELCCIRLHWERIRDDRHGCVVTDSDRVYLDFTDIRYYDKFSTSNRHGAICDTFETQIGDICPLRAQILKVDIPNSYI